MAYISLNYKNYAENFEKPKKGSNMWETIEKHSLCAIKH